LATDTLEKRHRDTADQFRANSGLKKRAYSGPIRSLIFLRFAEVRFTAPSARLKKASASVGRASVTDAPASYQAEPILHEPAGAWLDCLRNRSAAENMCAEVYGAMRDIEKHDPQLAGVLPKTYNLFTSTLPRELLKEVSGNLASTSLVQCGRSDYQTRRNI